MNHSVFGEVFIAGVLDEIAYPCRESEPGEFRANVQQGRTARLVVPTAEEKRNALKDARCMDLKVAGVDINRLLKGPLLLEVNSSPGLEGLEGLRGNW